jgi:hypothetical protein
MKKPAGRRAEQVLIADILWMSSETPDALRDAAERQDPIVGDDRQTTPFQSE